MAGQTQMIFLTSDEGLIRRISSKPSTTTFIIDLDNDEQVLAARNNNHIPNLIRADITAFNSMNNQSKKMKLSQKFNESSVCKICNDRAIGYNYDVLSCASCKTFFRRYAYQPRVC